MLRSFLLLSGGLLLACGSSGTGGGGPVGVPPLGGREIPPQGSDTPPGTYENPGSSSDPAGSGSGACLTCGGAFECSTAGAPPSYIRTEPAQNGQGCSIATSGIGVIVACGGQVLVQTCTGYSGQGCTQSEVGQWRQTGDGTLTVCASTTDSVCVVCTPTEAGPTPLPPIGTGQVFEGGAGFGSGGD